MGGPLILGQDGLPPCSGSSNEHSSPTMSDDEYLQQFHVPMRKRHHFQQVIERSMSVAAKRRVDSATLKLTRKCCLIENTDESNAMEYVHCFPRSTKNGLVSGQPCSSRSGYH